VSASLDRRSKFWAEQSGATLTFDKKVLATMNLPEALAKLLAANAANRQEPRDPVSPKAIPMRLSRLLDRALFESVVAKELRSLAVAPQLDAFFSGLVDLLSRLLAFRWMGLAATRGQVSAICVHALPNDENAVREDVASVLGARQDVRVTADERGRGERTSEDAAACGAGDLVVLEIKAGDEALGILALRGWDAKYGPGDRELLSLVQNELSHALRAVLLVEETKLLASTDMLTGLYNRRQGVQLFEQALSGAKRYGYALSVAMIDIDFFKKINDTYGHNSGDMALKYVTEIVRRTCRKADSVARWGGEEFLLVMPFTGRAGARVAGERVRLAVASKPVPIEHGREITVTVSIGAATHDSDSQDALVGRADKALYVAKSRGRNRVEVG
jgi:two-component system cell cycle response regulator